MAKQLKIKKKMLHWSIISSLAVLLVLWGSYKCIDSISKLDEFKINKEEISFAIPDWITDKGKHEINNLLLVYDGQTVFDKNLTEKIAKAYEDNPLFKRVVSVTRKFPNKIKVSLALRKPVATVKCKGKSYLVDSDSVKLPASYYNWPGTDENSVLITVDKLKDLPYSGKKWKDKRIHAGVDLLRFLKKNKAVKTLEINEIDVSNVGKRFATRKSEIIVWTKSGTKIKWGGAPLSGDLSELSDEEKLQNLFSVAKATGKKFDGLDYVDVRWFKPVAKSRS